MTKLAQRDPQAPQVTAEPTHPMLRAESNSHEIPGVTSKDYATARAPTHRSTRNSEAVAEATSNLPGEDLKGKAIMTRRSPTDSRSGLAPKADIEMLDASDSMTPSSRVGNYTPGLPALLSALNEARDSMMETIHQGRNTRHPDQTPVNSWSYKVYLACRAKDRYGGPEICEYFAKDLVRHLGPEWHQSELYKWAKTVDTKPEFKFSSEAECLGLTRRNSKKPKAAIEDGGESSRVGKRPAPAPAPGTAGKQPPRRRGRPSGKAAGLRPSLGGGKRLRMDEDDEDMDIDDYGFAHKKTAKKSKYFSDTELDDEADSSAAEGEEQGEGGKGGPLTRLVIRAERLPPITPKGPNQTWTCEEPDCGYIVRGADEEDGQNLISAHYEEHDKEARDEAQEAALTKANLAMKESGGHMPIKYVYFPPFLIQVHYMD